MWQMGFLSEPKIAFIVNVIVIFVSKCVSKVVLISGRHDRVEIVRRKSVSWRRAWRGCALRG